MTLDGHPVDVEHTLLKSRSFRRRPGEVPYPVQHIGASCSAFDVWNNMFRTQGQGLTLHKFVSPPAVVLDLGCGRGFWAVQAAKEWQNSTIVGFDIQDIQPRLLHAKAMKTHHDIAQRTKWIHGNLLDGLPFRSSYFDFVRVVNIGLGVPEDEWQFVFEEIARVMKPGGVIEVIEEDPIFPCARSPSPRANLRLGNSSTTLVDRAPSIIIPPSTTRLASRSRATIWSDPSTVTLHERYDLNSPTSLYDTSSPTTPLSAHPFAPSNVLPLSTSYLHNPIRDHLPRTHHRKASISLVETDNSSDLRDHSRLKAAWNAMLASRFIAENTLSVLPFYMSSSFVDVVNMPPLKVILPPNSEINPSGSRSERSSSESFLSSSSTALGHSHSTSSLTMASNSSMRTFTAAPSTLSRTSSGESIDSYSTECAQMHLATTVHTVTGCKEAIWHEYKKLYDINVAKVVSPDADAPSGHAASYVHGNVKSSIRESFEDEWDAWYNDMTDRIGMRALMCQLNWPEPPGQRPDWHVWRAKVPAEDRSPLNPSIPAIPDLCRSIRAFIGWKPL